MHPGVLMSAAPHTSPVPETHLMTSLTLTFTQRLTNVNILSIIQDRSHTEGIITQKTQPRSLVFHHCSDRKPDITNTAETRAEQTGTQKHPREQFGM